LKRYFSVENTFLQKLKGESGMMIIFAMEFFLPTSEESSHEPSAQCMFCHFDIAMDFWFLQSCGVLYKPTRHPSEQIATIFQATAQIIVQTVKFHRFISHK